MWLAEEITCFNGFICPMTLYHFIWCHIFILVHRAGVQNEELINRRARKQMKPDRFNKRIFFLESHDCWYRNYKKKSSIRNYFYLWMSMGKWVKRNLDAYHFHMVRVCHVFWCGVFFLLLILWSVLKIKVLNNHKHQQDIAQCEKKWTVHRKQVCRDVRKNWVLLIVLI